MPGQDSEMEKARHAAFLIKKIPEKLRGYQAKMLHSNPKIEYLLGLFEYLNIKFIWDKKKGIFEDTVI